MVSLIAAGERDRGRALEMLARRLGPVNYYSRPLGFDFTDYYGPEMGPGLSRRVAAFEGLVQPHRLAVIKRVCLSLERDLAAHGRRTVNLDPGLLNHDTLVLATVKPAGHRVCLEPGIYGEVTLLYANGDFRRLPWTYRDWTEPEMKQVLALVRARYQWQMNQRGNQGGMS